MMWNLYKITSEYMWKTHIEYVVWDSMQQALDEYETYIDEMYRVEKIELVKNNIKIQKGLTDLSTKD